MLGQCVAPSFATLCIELGDGLRLYCTPRRDYVVCRDMKCCTTTVEFIHIFAGWPGTNAEQFGGNCRIIGFRCCSRSITFIVSVFEPRRMDRAGLLNAGVPAWRRLDQRVHKWTWRASCLSSRPTTWASRYRSTSSTAPGRRRSGINLERSRGSHGVGVRRKPGRARAGRRGRRR